MTLKDKIFFIGYHKTATTTIHNLFSLNNVKSLHNYSYDSVKNNPLHQVFSDTGGVVPIKNCIKYHKLCHEYKNSTFVLNTRNLDGWLLSHCTHQYWLQARDKKSTENIHMYKTKDISSLIRSRVDEYKKIINFFQPTPERLLILNINRDNWLQFLSNHFDLKHFDLKLNVTQSSGNQYANNQNTPLEHIPHRDLLKIKKNIRSTLDDLGVKDASNPFLPKELIHAEEIPALLHLFKNNL